MTFCGKRVSADVLKDLEMRSSLITCVGPKTNDQCPYKRQKRTRHRHRGEGHVNTEAETGVILPQAKECLVTRSWKIQGQILPWCLQRDSV